jgi:predicted O-methyltransferase YrrM
VGGAEGTQSDGDEQVSQLLREAEALRAQLAGLIAAGGAHPLGHFYSPLPGSEEIARRLALIQASPIPRDLPGIDLRVERQLENLKAIGEAIAHAPPFPEFENEAFRYYYRNTQYGFNDAIILHGMLRVVRPRRVIEIGSGFSSAVMLDTNDRYLSGQLRCTFIEPYPDRLENLLRSGDEERCNVIKSKVQDVDPGLFATLEPDDVLFIDSSHVVKFGSDLEYIFREVLPSLSTGVYIHFHDIFYPFEYPEPWITEGHFWNECYMIRALLSHSSAYHIELFSDYIARFYSAELAAVSPLCLNNTGGNLWLSKTVLD